MPWNRGWSMLGGTGGIEFSFTMLEAVCGMEGAAIQLIRNYLGGRKQRVRYQNGSVSQWKEVPWGVPQGSVWGPLLFVMFCADIGDGVSAAAKTQFADDVTLVVSDSSKAEVIGKMNTALEQFHTYATANRMAAEPTKTQMMYSAAPRIRKEMKAMKY